MLDFPSNPSLGQLHYEFTFDGTGWSRPNLEMPSSMDAPSTGKEYVMVNSTWKVKRESATTLPAIFTPPSQAKGFKWRVVHTPGGVGVATQLAILLSENGGTSYPQTQYDHNYAGCVQWTGTTGYNSYPATQTSYLIGSFTSNNQLIPAQASGIMWLRRSTNVPMYSGFVYGWGYLDGTTVTYGRYTLRIWTSATAFSGTVIDSIYFYSAVGHSAVTGVQLTVEWIY